jgi:CRP-like cAMP-binding protein
VSATRLADDAYEREGTIAMQPLDLLGATQVFASLDGATLAALAQAAHGRSLDAGVFCYHQDDAATTAYVLINGAVRLSKLAADGRQATLRVIGPAEAFGIIAALPSARYPLSAQAVRPCSLLTWDSATLRDLMERYPVLALRALQVVSGRIVELQDQYLQLVTERVERRIARALVRLVRQAGVKAPTGVLIDLPLSRQDVAEMTGTTLYTVSRTLSRWEAQGLLAAGRERVIIHNPHGLVAIAEDLPGEGTATAL